MLVVMVCSRVPLRRCNDASFKDSSFKQLEIFERVQELLTDAEVMNTKGHGNRPIRRRWQCTNTCIAPDVHEHPICSILTACMGIIAQITITCCVSEKQDRRLIRPTNTYHAASRRGYSHYKQA